MTDAPPPNPGAQWTFVPGQILLGKYRADRVIGSGAMGVLVGAHHLSLEQTVAIKVMRSVQKTPLEARQRFLREAKATARIKSPHVARIFDVGQLETGELYIAMEYLDGIDLGRLLHEGGALSVTDAVSYIHQALMGLGEAHEVGIVHRDLKPENLFRTRDRDGSDLIKVLDFGLSKVEGTSEGSLTKTAAVFGTPLYISPEQLRDSKHVDGRTDLWSMGVILYTLLAGKNPFAADHIARVLINVGRKEPTRLDAVRSDVPAGLADVLEQAMEKDADHRFQTADEFAQALEPWLPTSRDAAKDGDRSPPPPAEGSARREAEKADRPEKPLSAKARLNNPRVAAASSARWAFVAGGIFFLVVLVASWFWARAHP
jgi:serine/threonine-protein kinase